MNLTDLIKTCPAVLAPMSGITDAPFRKLVHQFGGGYVISEMTACRTLLEEYDRICKKIQETGLTPHCVQLAGCDPDWMALGAKIAVEEAGADLIDINMGCPSKQVTSGQAGSALMRDLDLAERIINSVLSAVDKPVTLKMRLGWDETSLNALELAQRAEKSGIQMVFVHGRTRQQFYKGQADWKAVSSISQTVEIPVIINGDIVDFKTAQTALDESHAAGVMIGRASLGKPWLVGQIAAYLSDKEIPETPVCSLSEIMLEHYDHILSHYGSQKGVLMARKHLSAYLENLNLEPEEKKKLRSELCREENPNQVKNYLRSF